MRRELSIEQHENAFRIMDESSIQWQATYDYTTALHLLGLFDERPTDILIAANLLIPKINFGPGNPSNGRSALEVTLGNEYSRVMYIRCVAAYLPPDWAESNKDKLQNFCSQINGTRADEATVEIEGDVIVMRFWWD